MHWWVFINNNTKIHFTFENRLVGVDKTRTLINLAVNSGVKNFIFSSSAAVYAGNNAPLKESDELTPTNVYGQTKLEVEKLLKERENEIPSVSLRYFNAAGASNIGGVWRGENHEPETHLIPNILKVALGQKKKFVLFGKDYPTADGTCIRDYIHVEDLADAHILALEALVNNKFNCQAYNLGNDRGYSNLEMLNVAKEVTGVDIPVEFGDRREGDPAVLTADSNKIRGELGWQPKFSKLSDIISSAWLWHKNNPEGYKK